MKKNVFIDGREGTTGLRIDERLSKRSDINIIKIDESKRKDIAERSHLINMADIVFLCLPDEAAIQAVSLCQNKNTIIIDASTAHRVSDEWAYGLPELSNEYREKISVSKRISVPGCHASGFNLLIYPLRKHNIIDEDFFVTCHSITGYSGGGKKKIDEYLANPKPAGFDSPRLYALELCHKHLPEMKKHGLLKYPPVFNPIIADFYAGMVVSIPLHVGSLKIKDADELRNLYATYYNGTVKVMDVKSHPSDGFLNASTIAGYDFAEIYIFGNDEHLLLSARFDNLGKGASGAAVQCMNIAMGIDETTGLVMEA